VVTVKAAGAMVRVRLTDLDWAGEPESVTMKVSGDLETATLGVPVRAPDPLRARPEGRVPEVSDQVRGLVPPVAERVVL